MLRRPLVIVAVALAAAVCSVALLSRVDAATTPEFGYDDGVNIAAVVVGSPSAGRLLAMSSPTFLQAQAHSVGFSRPDRARVAPRSITSVADDLGALCRTNSFVPATLVLMADGTTKSISDVQVGDMVMATDPETGQRGPRRVSETIVGDGIKELVDIEIDGDVITATDRHPFWVDDQGRWIDAEDLQAGDVLLLANGRTATVDAVRERTEVRRVHNLTVDGIHTYFVLAGDDPVLVHNCAMPSGLGNASRGLESVFEGGSVRGRSILRLQAFGRISTRASSS